MRFALITTSAAAAIAIPLAVQASGPHMSDHEFLSAVRCTAYETVLDPAAADLGLNKMRLNAEAQRQPIATAERAHDEVNSIERRAAVANAADAVMMRSERAAACSEAALVTGRAGQGAA